MMVGNLLGELMAWQDGCEASEAENAALKARIAELEAKLAKPKKRGREGG